MFLVRVLLVEMSCFGSRRNDMSCIGRGSAEDVVDDAGTWTLTTICGVGVSSEGGVALWWRWAWAPLGCRF